MCYSLRFDYDVPGLAKSDFSSYAPGSGDLSINQNRRLINQEIIKGLIKERVFITMAV